MDNDDATIGRIFTRREALRAAAAAGLVVGLGSVGARFARAATTTAPFAAAATQPTIHLVASPAMTEGPFFVDEKLNRSDLLAGTKRATVLNGLPLLLTLTVYQFSGSTYAPLPGVHVDLWNADASGAYSDESDPMNTEDTAGQHWLRGYQVSDTTGVARFQTILPGWYNGRAPHIHFKVRQFDSAEKKVAKEFTSQLFLTDADRKRIYSQRPYSTYSSDGTVNDDDGIYSEVLPDGSVAGKLMTLSLRPNPAGRGHAADFAIALTDASFNAQSGRRDRGPGGHGGPGGPSGPGGRPPGPPPDGFDPFGF